MTNTFEDNDSTPIVSGSGSLTIEDSTIKQALSGPTIYNGRDSTMTLYYTTLKTVTAPVLYNNGRLTLKQVTFNGVSGSPCFNTGILNDDHKVCVR